jgi:hypothetical protein
MCRVKATGQSRLLLGDQEIQKTSRYYVAVKGATLIKRDPPTGPQGAFKKANGISDHEYISVMRETNGAWDARVCTKNKSRYEIRETNIQAGRKVALCNDASHFDFNNIDYGYYIDEARKLII